MENCYRPNDTRLGYLTDECSGPIAVRSKIIRSQQSLPDCAGETEPQARSKPLEKYPEQKYPRFPERHCDSISHEIPNRYDSSFAAKYPYYDNQLHTENISKNSTSCGRSTGTDHVGIQTHEEEEDICREPTTYRTNRNTFNALAITSPSASSESEPEVSWDDPNETHAKKSFKGKTARKTGERITRRKMKPKNQTTNSPNSCFQEKLSDYHGNWTGRNTSKIKALPDNREQSEVRTSPTENYKESYDERDDSISHGIPYSYGSSSATYPLYDNQVYSANTNMTTKFAGHTESGDDDRQTEHTTYEESKPYERRKNAPSSSKMTIMSSISPQQWPSKGTYPETALKNNSEKETESWRTKREMELMNQVNSTQNVYLQEESSDYSDDEQRCTENIDHMTTKVANISETDDDDRQTKQRTTYKEPKTCSRRNFLISSGMAFKSDDSGVRQTSRGMSSDTDRRNITEKQMGNQCTRREMRLRSQTDNDQNFCPQEESLDYSDERARRNERLNEGRRPYLHGEVTRKQYSFEEVEPNSFFSTKDDPKYNDFSQAICGAKGRSTEYGNHNRLHTSKWKNEKAVERPSSEARAQRWDVLESNQKTLLNPDSDYARTRERNYQARGKEFSFDYGNQDRKSFVDRVSRCAAEESIETGNVEYFKHGTQGREELCSREKLYGRRASDSCEESENGVTEINQERGRSDRYSERRQQFQGNHYNRNLTLSGRCIPEFSRGDRLHTSNGFHELPGSKRYSERQEPCQDVPYRNKNLGRCDPQDYLHDQNKDGSCVRFLPNSNPPRLVKNSYWDVSDYYRRENEQTSRFIFGTSSTSRNVGQQNGREGRSASRSVSGTERVYKDSYKLYPSLSSLDDEEQTSISLEKISNDSRSVHESNMSTVRDAVIADLSDFGSKLNEAIRSSHAALQLFKVACEEWLKTRDATLRMSRDLQAEIGGNGDWQSSFDGFCNFLKSIGDVAEQILMMTPYAPVAVPVVRIVPSVFKKLGDVIIAFAKRNKKKEPKFLDMFQVLKADIEESSQLRLFALQCEMQFRETEQLFIEFRDALFSQQMADAVEDMELLNFIIRLSEANPTSGSFFPHISDAYRKFYNSGKEEPSATREAFCSFIDRDPSALETLQYIDWQFTKSFQNCTAEQDLIACWCTISTLVSSSSSNTKEAEEALNRIAVIIRILETQRNFVNANVSRLFKAS